MVRLSLKQIKAELEKKTTLDEKKKYLSEILKRIKGAKLRAKVEGLLKETEKHIGHEEKFAKDKLEKKITAEIPAAEEPSQQKAFAEVKYVPRRREPEVSGLEKEVKAAAPAKGFEFGPPKYLTFAGGGYVNVREAAERVRMLENQGLMKRVTAEEFYSMDPAKRQQLFKTVSEAFDKPLEDYDAFQKFVKYVAIKKEKEEQKYSTKRW